jgi:hypothetical protein
MSVRVRVRVRVCGGGGGVSRVIRLAEVTINVMHQRTGLWCTHW